MNQLDMVVGLKGSPCQLTPQKTIREGKVVWVVMGAVKTFTLKMKLAKKIKQNRPGIVEDCEDMKLLKYNEICAYICIDALKNF